jgi:hypothetical protein
LRSDLLAWPRIWSVLGVSKLVGTSYTENRKACGGHDNRCQRTPGARR